MRGQLINGKSRRCGSPTPLAGEAATSSYLASQQVEAMMPAYSRDLVPHPRRRPGPRVADNLTHPDLLNPGLRATAPCRAFRRPLIATSRPNILSSGEVCEISRPERHWWARVPDRLRKYLMTFEDSTNFYALKTGLKVWAALNSQVLKADDDEVMRVWSSAGMKGQGKREIPEKTRLPAVPSGTIPTCEKFGSNLPGIKTGTTWTQEMVWLIVNDLNYDVAKELPLIVRGGPTPTDTSALSRRVHHTSPSRPTFSDILEPHWLSLVARGGLLPLDVDEIAAALLGASQTRASADSFTFSRCSSFSVVRPRRRNILELELLQGSRKV
ncbi:hypothetical protein PR048_033746 [Dryococelus australis]|uniref:Uncharacterized protein n=1 Tax=Dryococelus australis TaxID=614101 RepID=A0ABQ9FZ24_9NEOP|nr:hypothetical protein PR048_033746 [Dryococelus australis]